MYRPHALAAISVRSRNGHEMTVVRALYWACDVIMLGLYRDCQHEGKMA